MFRHPLSNIEAAELSNSGKCSGIVSDYRYNSKLVAEYRIHQDSGMLEFYEERLKKAEGK